MITPTELAYMAGIIDGEGCITAVANTKRGRSYYNAHMSVMTTDRCLADWIQTRFGGIVCTRPTPILHPTWKVRFEWHMYKHGMDIFIPQLLPYLIIKHKHAEKMLEFRETFGASKTGHTHPLPDDIVNQRKKLYEELKSMNRNRKSR